MKRESKSSGSPELFSVFIDRARLFFGSCLNNLGESICIPHSQISQHLAVEDDVGIAHAINQPTVSRAVQARGGIDAHDP